MTTREEMQQMMQEMFERQNEMFHRNKKEMENSFDFRIDELKQQMVIVSQQVTTFNDNQNTNIDSLREELKSELLETIDTRIRETEERFGFVNNVLEDKVYKNRGQLIDIIDYGYKQSKQRLEEASTDLRASIKAIDEKTETSLKLVNRQIEINDERVENKLSTMKLYNENTRDHVVRTLSTADNNMKDFDRRLTVM